MQQQLGAGLCAPQELLSTLSRQGSFSGSTGGWLDAGAAGLVQGGGAQISMQQQQQQLEAGLRVLQGLASLSRQGSFEPARADVPPSTECGLLLGQLRAPTSRLARPGGESGSVHCKAFSLR
jgi:hypothetical protein